MRAVATRESEAAVPMGTSLLRTWEGTVWHSHTDGVDHRCQSRPKGSTVLDTLCN